MIDQWVFMFLMIALIASNLLGVVVLIWGIRSVSYQQACIISLLKCSKIVTPLAEARSNSEEYKPHLTSVGRASAPNLDIG